MFGLIATGISAAAAIGQSIAAATRQGQESVAGDYRSEYDERLTGARQDMANQANRQIRSLARSAPGSSGSKASAMRAAMMQAPDAHAAAGARAHGLARGSARDVMGAESQYQQGQQQAGAERLQMAEKAAHTAGSMFEGAGQANTIGGGIKSDEASKQRIQKLEGELAQARQKAYEAGQGAATGEVARARMEAYEAGLRAAMGGGAEQGYEVDIGEAQMEPYAEIGQAQMEPMEGAPQYEVDIGEAQMEELPPEYEVDIGEAQMEPVQPEPTGDELARRVEVPQWIRAQFAPESDQVSPRSDVKSKQSIRGGGQYSDRRKKQNVQSGVEFASDGIQSVGGFRKGIGWRNEYDGPLDPGTLDIRQARARRAMENMGPPEGKMMEDPAAVGRANLGDPMDQALASQEHAQRFEQHMAEKAAERRAQANAQPQAPRTREDIYPAPPPPPEGATDFLQWQQGTNPPAPPPGMAAEQFYTEGWQPPGQGGSGGAGGEGASAAEQFYTDGDPAALPPPSPVQEPPPAAPYASEPSPAEQFYTQDWQPPPEAEQPPPEAAPPQPSETSYGPSDAGDQWYDSSWNPYMPGSESYVALEEMKSSPEGLRQLASRGVFFRGKSPADPSSDVRGKQAIETVRKAPGFSYEYKPEHVGPGAPPGRHVGPMAQDLEKTKLGREMVGTGPDGMKNIDTSRMPLTNHAAIYDIDERLRRLEQGNA